MLVLNRIALCAWLGALFMLPGPALGSGNELSSESSARFLGTVGAGKEAVAGVAAGSLFNPALAVHGTGTNVSLSGTILHADSSHNVTTNLGGVATDGDFLPAAFLGSLAITHSLSSDWAIGLAVRPSFGLSVDYGPNWSGAALVTRAELEQLAIAPLVSYRVNSVLSVGFAPIIEIGHLKFSSRVAAGEIRRTYDYDVAFGGLAGAHINLPNGTEIGLTYRRNPDHTFRGERTGVLPADSTASINNPDVASIGLRHPLSDNLALLASVDWLGWSDTKATRIVEPGVGTTVIPRQWADGWRYGVGLEYELSEAITLRAGFALSEGFIEPRFKVPDAPFDMQRRYGFGLTYRPSTFSSWDIAYGFTDLGENRLNLSAADFGGLAAQGTLEAGGHVFALQYNVKFDRSTGSPF